jgi:ATP-dependent Clp protease ATP-binding subunit ClpA
LGDFELPLSFRSPLGSYPRDLTSAATRDQLEPMLCRDAEIERVITILLRESKNNPVLAGAAGVGKTAIAEGLAQKRLSSFAGAALIVHRVILKQFNMTLVYIGLVIVGILVQAGILLSRRNASAP